MKTCEFCSKEISKYKCPKCLRNYCSVECYKSQTHMECSERFYKDCFMEGLKEDELEDRDGVARMLKGLGGVDDTMPDESLEEIFKSLRLGREGGQMWDMLGREEKGAFISMHSRQDFSPIIQTWMPWWQHTLPKLIHDDNHLREVIKNLPKLFNPSSINTLISHKTPSNTIAFDIINLLYGYCYVCRLHNGDLSDLLLDSAQALVSLSSSLLSQTFECPSSSIDHCFINLSKNQPADCYFVSSHFSVAVINDVVSILKGGNTFSPNLYLKAALSHARSLLKKACLKLKNYKEVTSQLFTRQTFMKAYKKTEFYLSWLESERGGVEGLGGLVEVLLHSKMTELNKRKVEKEFIESNMEKLKPKVDKKLIEEI